jgi:hypothetical protein
MVLRFAIHEQKETTGYTAYIRQASSELAAIQTSTPPTPTRPTKELSAPSPALQLVRHAQP